MGWKDATALFAALTTPVRPYGDSPPPPPPSLPPPTTREANQAPDPPINCQPGFSCVTSDGVASCQKTALSSSSSSSTFHRFSNSSSTFVPTIPTTLSTTLSSTSSAPHRTDSSTTASPSPQQSTRGFTSMTLDFATSPTDTSTSATQTTLTTAVGNDLTPGGCGLFGSACETRSGSNSSSIAPPKPNETGSGSGTSGTPAGGLPGETITSSTFPIVIPSTLVVIAAIVASVIGNRRNWVSRAFGHLSRERQQRRALSAILGGDATLIDDDAIPLRDLQTPPPAYTPYQFSRADRELLGPSYFATMGSDASGGDGVGDGDFMGLAYPLGDRGRHRST